MRLVACQFAGANQYAYRPIAARLRPEIETICVELPGRGRRFSEPCCTDVREMVNDLIGPIAAKIGNEPYVLYGHSMGARIAYLLAHALPKQGAREPLQLVVSGSSAPVRPLLTQRHLMPRAQFLEDLRAYGGCPEEFFTNPDLLEIFLPVLRADFQAVETYRRDPAPPLTCPITVLRGTDDDVTREAAHAWSEETSAGFTVHDMTGGHFFIFEHVGRVAAILREALGLSRSLA